MLTPKQICETLTVSPSTLRRWANRFSSHLSVGEHKPGKHREYTAADLNIFRSIQTHLENGLTYSEIEKRLAVVDQPDPDPSTALLSLPEFTHAIETARATIASMQSEIEELKERQTQINEWFSMPFWKRFFTKPPQS